MALNEKQILSFLDDGTSSDIDILNSESENELEDLLNKFSNDDFSAELDNEMLANTELDLHEEDDQTTNETQSGNEVFEGLYFSRKYYSRPYICRQIFQLTIISTDSILADKYYSRQYFSQQILQPNVF